MEAVVVVEGGGGGGVGGGGGGGGSSGLEYGEKRAPACDRVAMGGVDLFVFDARSPEAWPYPAYRGVETHSRGFRVRPFPNASVRR